MCEARLAQGNRELAEQTAERALKLSGDNPQEHAAVADRLVERGLIEWADRELRQIIVLGPIGIGDRYPRPLSLADSLHDRRRDLEAAEVLQDADGRGRQRSYRACSACAVSRQQSDVTIEPAAIQHVLHYLACDACAATTCRSNASFSKRRWSRTRTNVDVLIGLYRLAAQEPKNAPSSSSC